MSGWIKIEKDLETDPRVLRMAKALGRKFLLFTPDQELDPCNACAFPGVTLVCGALTRLWIYADSHIRGDDTLDMGAAEIDEWLGIPGFCAAMPEDWLREIDEHTVELPGFQDHNGVEAKRKALTQKRVARHRNAKALQADSGSNASALPDQTRPDQTKTRKEGGRLNGASARKSLVPRDWPLTEKLIRYAESKGVRNRKVIEDFHENFIQACHARGLKYLDHEDAWMTWLRKDIKRGEIRPDPKPVMENY